MISQQAKLNAIASQERASRAELAQIAEQLRSERDATQQAYETLWQQTHEVSFHCQGGLCGVQDDKMTHSASVDPVSRSCKLGRWGYETARKCPDVGRWRISHAAPQRVQTPLPVVLQVAATREAAEKRLVEAEAEKAAVMQAGEVLLAELEQLHAARDGGRAEAHRWEASLHVRLASAVSARF